MNAIALADLVLPTKCDEFIDQYFVAEQHHLSASNPSVVETLLKVEELRHFDRFVAKVQKVDLFGPGTTRAAVDGESALEWYARGATLYISRAEAMIPSLLKIFAPVLGELGIRPIDVSVELFAGRAGALSSLHWDNDTNFQCLIAGRKRWLIQPNAHIRYPMLPHHDLGQPTEEGFANTLPLPSATAELSAPTTLIAESGTCLFFPIGYWHEVEILEDALAINLVLRPARWIDLFPVVLRKLLQAHAELRSPTFGLTGGHAALRAQAAKGLALAQALFADKAQGVSQADIALARNTRRLRWVSGCANPVVVTMGTEIWLSAEGRSVLAIEPDVSDLVSRLCRLRGTFALEHVRALAPAVGSDRVLAIVEALVDAGCCEYV